MYNCLEVYVLLGKGNDEMLITLILISILATDLLRLGRRFNKYKLKIGNDLYQAFLWISPFAIWVKEEESKKIVRPVTYKITPVAKYFPLIPCLM